ncbi:hypothetical protein F4806DRAFT_245375 [Annulohypoxylon nitens]|nr:hypothetical protein F4806DRAFT_245375 [Annulohypoxylon nitens]
MNDIIEVGPLEAQKELLNVLERRLNCRLDTIRQLRDSIDMSYDPFSSVEGPKMLYDLGSHHLYFMIKGHFLSDDLLDGAIRASLAEEFLFGEKITIGHVPRVLRHFNQRPSTDFMEFMGFYDAGTPALGLAPYLCLDPLFILRGYIYLLHKLAGGTNHFSDLSLLDSGYVTPHGILNVFVALMDGLNCPVCQAPILNRIRERFPQLSLQLVDIIFPIVSHRNPYFQKVMSAWPPVRAIPIDNILR